MSLRYRHWLCILIIGVLASLSAPAWSQEKLELKHLPVQDGGRLKPFDTYAREALQLVHGRQSYMKRPAYEVVMTWMLAPQIWEEKEFVRLDHPGLKRSLKLPEEEQFFSPSELMSNPRLDLVMRELGELRKNNSKLTPYFQAVQRLENQLMTFHAMRVGAQRVVPPLEGTTWVSIQELEGDAKDRFIAMSRAFALHLGAMAQNEGREGDPSSLEGGEQDLHAAVGAFVESARAQNPELYPDTEMMKKEVAFNELHPFRWAWILYLSAAIFALIAWQTSWRIPYAMSWAGVIAGLGFHSYGFYIRTILTGRPPVSNMYETVVWVAWGAVFFAMLFEYLQKKRVILLAGTVVATLCMITADNAPVILDKSLQPLEPVLRSNLWLIVHVLTITLSYAPLFLACILGAIGLWFVIRNKGEDSQRVKMLAHACYRCIQIGVVLLAAGTILGGVWADYSWGRFWGWDPKETWAFIALMGYLAILHGRLVGWVKNFGMLAGSVIAFNLVIMAWYGVNFVLGAGLHSYGFGAGGIEYVAGFCGLFLIFTVYAGHVRYLSVKASRHSG